LLFGGLRLRSSWTGCGEGGADGGVSACRRKRRKDLSLPR